MLPDDIMLDHKLVDAVTKIWEYSSGLADKPKATKPELNDAQRAKHARIPALQSAWDQYMAMWDLTHGD
jgi:hypothetical protein